MIPGNAAAFVLVAVLTGVALWRRYFWVGLILLALSAAPGGSSGSGSRRWGGTTAALRWCSRCARTAICPATARTRAGRGHAPSRRLRPQRKAIGRSAVPATLPRMALVVST